MAATRTIVIAPANALAFIPDGLSAVEAGPLLCAGITTFNSLRNSGARPGDTVAILGIGGLGHLAVQYAAKSGYRTVAVARGEDKGPLAKQLGAHVYIDSTKQDPAAELQKLGGAVVILSTLTSADALAQAVNGLAQGGKLIINGVPEKPWELNAGPSYPGPPHGDGLAFGHGDGFRRHAQLQRPHGNQAYDRGLPPGEGRGRIRPHDEREGSIPGGRDHRGVKKKVKE